MIKINLTPIELLEKAKQKQQVVQMVMVAAVVLVFVAGISTVHFMKAHKVEEELVEAEADLKRLDAIVKKVEDLERTAKAVRSRLKVIDDLLTGRPLYPIFMSDFVSTVPSGVWVKNLNTTTDKGNKLKLVLSAEAQSSEQILEWITILEDTKKFSEIEMGAVTATGDAGARIHVFGLNLTYAAKFD